MATWAWVALGAAAAGLAGLAVTAARNREAARAVAGFLPDCAVLLRRLVSDRAVSPWVALGLGAAVLYLLMPFDLVPDFLPVVGHLDDALVVVLALRVALRAAGPEAVAARWPGPPGSLGVVIRMAG